MSSTQLLKQYFIMKRKHCNPVLHFCVYSISSNVLLEVKKVKSTSQVAHQAGFRSMKRLGAFRDASPSQGYPQH